MHRRSVKSVCVGGGGCCGEQLPAYPSVSGEDGYKTRVCGLAIGQSEVLRLR